MNSGNSVNLLRHKKNVVPQALARLSVKDAKIDELSDQLAQNEVKMNRYEEEISFFKHNQTDEIKVKL